MRNEQITTAPPPEVAAISDFALTLERCGSETAVLRLAGELDLYRAPAIEDALAEAIGPKLARDRVRKPLTRRVPGRGCSGSSRESAPPDRRPPLGHLHRLGHARPAPRREPTPAGAGRPAASPRRAADTDDGVRGDRLGSPPRNQATGRRTEKRRCTHGK